MSELYTDKLAAETLVAVTAASLTTSLVTFMTTAVVHEGRVLMIHNGTDVDIAGSVDDATNAQFMIPAGSSMTVDLKRNAIRIHIGSVIKLKELASATTGSAYIAVLGA